MDKKFVELCICGEAHINEIDNYIDAWHDSSKVSTLAEYLGFTCEENLAFINDERNIGLIIELRRNTR